MPVSGIVIRCPSQRADEISSQIASLPGLEVHGTLPDGQIIAVLETDTVDKEVNLVSEIQQTPGVVSVNLAYHNFEDIAV